jgi:hypothetical protein
MEMDIFSTTSGYSICSLFNDAASNSDWITSNYWMIINNEWGRRWCSWLKHYVESRKAVGSIPDEVIGFFK